MIENTFRFPILSVLCYLPLVGSLCIMLFFRKEQARLIKLFAFSISLATFALSLSLIPAFQINNPGMQFV
ncbi:MAG: NADH-quinone oxidoreductase subunit M, partial [Candidatus Omnitrophota bacterium]